MKKLAIAFLALSALAPLLAQEVKPVPKDSVRVQITGCSKGYVFTAHRGNAAADERTDSEIRDGMHLRMNGPKATMKEIKSHEGSLITITGLMKKGQMGEGVGIGGGVRVGPGGPPSAGGFGYDPGAGQIQIDVEGWRPALGSCPER